MNTISNVAKQLGITPAAIAQANKTPAPKRSLASYLTATEREVARQVGMSAEEYAAGLAKQAPAAFADRMLAAAAAKSAGFKSGDRVRIEPGLHGVCTGTIKFEAIDPDGFLTAGVDAAVTPGDDDGVVSGPVAYLGDQPPRFDFVTGERLPDHVIADGDIIAIGSRTRGRISKASGSASSTKAIRAKTAELEARVERDKAAARAKAKAANPRAAIAPGAGFTSGTRIAITGGQTDARGPMTFDTKAADGLLRSGDHVVIDDPSGEVAGVLTYNGASPDPSSAPRSIAEGDPVLVGTVYQAEGKISKVGAKASASEARSTAPRVVFYGHPMGRLGA